MMGVPQFLRFARLTCPSPARFFELMQRVKVLWQRLRHLVAALSPRHQLHQGRAIHAKVSRVYHLDIFVESKVMNLYLIGGGQTMSAECVLSIRAWYS